MSTICKILQLSGVPRRSAAQAAACRPAGGRHGPLAVSPDVRFWAKVKNREGDGCWEWHGAFAGPYGIFGFAPRVNVSAHRAAWVLTHGPIPDGLWVLHKCDNPKCVRPDHLFLGTPRDNSRDMVKKERHRPNGRCPSATTTLTTAFNIRHLRATRKATWQKLARVYRISNAVVGDILMGRSYLDIPPQYQVVIPLEDWQEAILDEPERIRPIVGDELQKACQLYREGHTVDQVRNILGRRCIATVWKALRGARVPMRPRSSPRKRIGA